MNNLERFYLGRYLQAPKRNLLRFSFVFMILGIVLSVGILSAGLNLFQGYESSLREVLLGSFPHIAIQDADSDYISMEDAEKLISTLKSNDKVEMVTPTVTYSVMAANDTRVRGVSLNAYYFDAHNPFPYAKYVKEGSSQLADGEIIVGKYLAKELGKKCGDTLKIVYPQLDKISAMGLFPSERLYKIAGIYSSGFYESDRSQIICTINDAVSLLNITPSYAKLELRLKPGAIDDATHIAEQLQQQLGLSYLLYPWTTFSAGLLRLVTMEKWLIFIIFSFLVLISGINVISAVTTIIFDKRNEIAVLRTLGSSNASIKRLLALQVGLTGIAAIISGQLFGALLSFLVEKQSWYHLKGDVYFIDSLQATISPLNQMVVFLVSALLISGCIWYPLKQIDKMQIIELLRNS